jgi:hypothetical protein
VQSRDDRNTVAGRTQSHARGPQGHGRGLIMGGPGEVCLASTIGLRSLGLGRPSCARSG